MKTELFYLALTAVFTGLLWIPYVLDRFAVRGLGDTVGYPDNPKPQHAWAQRLQKAHINAVENLVVFATLGARCERTRNLRQPIGDGRDALLLGSRRSCCRLRARAAVAAHARVHRQVHRADVGRGDDTRPVAIKNARGRRCRTG